MHQEAQVEEKEAEVLVHLEDLKELQLPLQLSLEELEGRILWLDKCQMEMSRQSHQDQQEALTLIVVKMGLVRLVEEVRLDPITDQMSAEVIAGLVIETKLVEEVNI